MLLLLGQAVECANNARRCAIATTKNVLTILFAMPFSIIFATFLSRVVFFVIFPSVFFQDAPLTPALSLQKKTTINPPSFRENLPIFLLEKLGSSRP